MPKWFPSLLLPLAIAACATTPVAPTASLTAAPSRAAAPAAPASRTHWILEPAQAYDAIAFVNLLTGDPFYVDKGYRADYERWMVRLDRPEKVALVHLVQRIKEQEHGLIYPFLAFAFSGVEPRTLADLQHIVSDDTAWQRMIRTYADVPGTAAGDLRILEDVRRDLGVMFAFLQRAGWDKMWTDSALPRVRAYLAANASIRDFDVVGDDEEVLGRRLDVPSVTAYVMAYGSPHGVRVQGWRFLTDISYPPRVLLRTALHELLHPPFKREGELDRLLNELGKDPYFERLVKEHDPSFGYTTAAGLIEEDCATAVNMYNAERRGLQSNIADYYRKSDDGIHVFSFLLYRRLKERHQRQPQRYEEVVKQAVQEIQAQGGLEAAFLAVPARYEVKALRK
jgi:hypothetical protein